MSQNAALNLGRLIRLMAVRVALITLLLGSTLLFDVFGREPLNAHTQFPILFLIIGTYVLTLIHAFLLHRFPLRLRFLAALQILGDLVLSAAVIYITGGAESPYLFLWALTVLSASLLFGRRGGLSIAFLAILLLILLTVQRIIAWNALPAPSIEILRRLLVNAITHMTAILLIGLLSGYLSDQLRATNQQLRFANRDLAQLEALNQQILTSIRSGLLSYRSDFTVLFANPAALQLLGLTLQELTAEPIIKRFPKLEHAETTDWEESYPTPDGERILQFSLSPLDAPDAPGGWILSLHDQTRLRQMEQQAERSSRLAAIGKMAAGIAHEIRNPLAAISGSIQMLNDLAAPDSLELKLSGIIHREAERLNHLVTDFLRLARPAPPQKARFNARIWLEEIASLFKSEANGIELTLDCPGDAMIDADGEQLRQVIWNLLKNAAEARATQITLKCEALPHEARLCFTDDGSGIPPDIQKKIFDPFYTTKDTGSGLGLAVVHRIVEEHGGQIELQSVPRHTQFTVHLPISPIAPKEPA